MENKILESLLNADEGQTFETKRALKKPSEVLPTICAFANTDGGTFIYGIADKKHAVGKERFTGIIEGGTNHEELLKLIANNFTPPLPDITSRCVDIVNTHGQNDRMLIILVSPSKEVHSLMSGHTYVRRGSQNNLICLST